jgi:hypothetical protein
MRSCTVGKVLNGTIQHTSLTPNLTIHLNEHPIYLMIFLLFQLHGFLHDVKHVSFNLVAL